MKDHPEYYERMVAAYTVGWARNQAYYERNTHLKFAEGETDTGVIISWNTFVPGASETGNIVLPENALAINPLNWKRDNSYAGPEANLGSLVSGEIVMNYADAQLDPDMGWVISNTEYSPISYEGILGEGSLHGGDYPLFFNNVKENVQKRIDACMADK